MTRDQRTALGRMRGTYTIHNDNDNQRALFNLEDVMLVLGIIDEYEQLLGIVKDDLRDMREVLSLNQNDLGVTEMVDSTLTLLTEGDSA